MTDRTGAQTYFLYDGLGSTANVTDGSGTVLRTYSYDVFGAIRSESGPGAVTNEFRFTGEQRDRQFNRNFYYLRARYYDPATGRFLSQDPLPAGNLYAYVGNNPVNFVDPSGLLREGGLWDRCDPRWAEQQVALGADPRQVFEELRGTLYGEDYSEERDCIIQAALEDGDPLVSLIRGNRGNSPKATVKFDAESLPAAPLCQRRSL